jgi:metallo-beta-lactamase class B
MQATDGGKTYNVMIIGSPNVNDGYQLVNNKEYPQISTDFARTFKVLKSLPCEIFLGAHGDYYGLVGKYPRMKDGVNPFIDPAGCKAYIADREQYYLKVLAEQSK